MDYWLFKSILYYFLRRINQKLYQMDIISFYGMLSPSTVRSPKSDKLEQYNNNSNVFFIFNNINNHLDILTFKDSKILK